MGRLKSAAILSFLLISQLTSAEVYAAGGLSIKSPSRHEEVAGAVKVDLSFSPELHRRTKSLTLLIDNVPIGKYDKARRQLWFDSTPLRKCHHNLKVYAYDSSANLIGEARVPIITFTHNPGSPALPKLRLTAKQVRASAVRSRGGKTGNPGSRGDFGRRRT